MLIFDDGPTALTPRILDLLAQHNQRAVFFLIGDRIPDRRNTVERIIGEGHAVGNHTMSHQRLTLLEDAAVHSEIEWCRDAIAEVTGEEPTAFRPPFVAYTDRILEIAQDLGHDTMVLTPSLGDYALDPYEIVERAEGVEIIGLHELPQTLAALPQLLAEAA